MVRGEDFSRPDPSPPEAARAQPSGPQASSSSGWTSSRSWPGSPQQLGEKKTGVRQVVDSIRSHFIPLIKAEISCGRSE